MQARKKFSYKNHADVPFFGPETGTTEDGIGDEAGGEHAWNPALNLNSSILSNQQSNVSQSVSCQYSIELSNFRPRACYGKGFFRCKGLDPSTVCPDKW
jgi:hypothetical protein